MEQEVIYVTYEEFCGNTKLIHGHFDVYNWINHIDNREVRITLDSYFNQKYYLFRII